MFMRLAKFVLAAAVGAVAISAHGQTFPLKPVRMIIPFAPGGSSEANARSIQDKLSAIWKQPVIIEMRPGANTIIGTEGVAKSVPDGHTLLLTSTAYTVNPSMYAKLPYDPLTDLLPITIVSMSPLAMVATNSLTAKSAADVIAMEKAKPGSVSFGVSDSSSQLALHLFNMLAGINLQVIPYKGAGPMMIDLVGGHVPLGFAAVSTVQGQVRAGRVRLLGVGSPKPSPIFPDAPAIAQSGLPGFEAIPWFALFAPKGTPKDIIDRIHRDMVTVLHDPDVRKRLATLGAEPGGQSPEEFDARVRSEIEIWSKVAKSAGIKPE